MALKLDYAPGATPLDPDELSELIPSSVSTRAELDELEAANIAEGMQWAIGRTRDVLAWGYMEQLHRRMFGRVWRWAGLHRKSEKNIGVAPQDIASQLKNLLEDVREQVRSRSMEPEEIAARFHHRLTKIHPFANGNGRHARMMTDLLLEQLGGKLFTWGEGDLLHAGDVRQRYIEALRAADARDYGPFSRSFARVPRVPWSRSAGPSRSRS
jgi:Fic-DOC domain mobile mystery protein B